MVFTALVCAASFLLLITFVTNIWRYPKQPPGPWKLPVVGHLLFVGTEPFETLLRWKHKYGSIYRVNFLNFPSVLLNDAKMIREAFSQKALSGRASLAVFEAGNGKGIAVGNEVNVFQLRRFAITYLRSLVNNLDSFEARINPSISRVLEKFREAQTNNVSISIPRIFDMAMVDVLWKIIYSEDSSPLNLVKMHDLMKTLANSSSDLNLPTVLAIFLPWIRKVMPEGFVINQVQVVYEKLLPMLKAGTENCKVTRVKGQPRGLVDAFLDEADCATDPKSPFLDEEHLLVTSFDFFIGGTEPPSVALDWLLFFMARNLPAQERLQMEIDEVIGSKRRPSISDKPNMPFAEAVLQETFRLSSLLPIGLPHRAMEDTILRGYTIKKGDLIIANTSVAHLDPEVWENPREFHPERFLDPSGTKVIRNEDVVLFSAGRRMCVGEAVAKNMIFLLLTNLFQNFSFEWEGSPPGRRPLGGIAWRPPQFRLRVINRLRLDS